jgi:hypothetical protein
VAENKLKKIYSGIRSANCSPKKLDKPTDLSGLSRIQLQQVNKISQQIDSFAKKNSLQQLKELSKSSPVRNKFEVARDEALEILTQLLEMLLVPPQDMPLHELLLFDNLDLAKKELMGNSRLALNDALANPHKYLQVKIIKFIFSLNLLFGSNFLVQVLCTSL